MCNIFVIGDREKRDKGTEEIFETIMTENFPKLISDTKTTGPGSSENTKQKIQKGKKKKKKKPKLRHPGCIMFIIKDKFQKS